MSSAPQKTQADALMTRSTRALLPLVCTILVVGILSAGLWPFHGPSNAVVRLNGGGLSFGEHGAAVTTNPFKVADWADHRSCSLEMWVHPIVADSGGTILAFFRPDNFAVLFEVRQSLGDLELRHGPLTRHPPKGARMYADDVFRSPRWVFLTITANAGGTLVYSDGKLVARHPGFELSSGDFTGRLMIGNAPGIIDNWSGQIRGLGIYSRELSAGEVARNYTGWARGDTNSLAGRQDLRALYRFNEGGGNSGHNVVLNEVETASDLQIPERFFVLNKPFLELPWDEFYLGWNYWGNLALNVIAFFPLGFAFCALLWSARIFEGRLFLTITVGFAVSLTIEVLQAFLPTRKSGLTDLFTNTLGTALGAILYRYAAYDWRTRIARYRMPVERSVMEDSRSEGIH
jgi:hypothetical protein